MVFTSTGSITSDLLKCACEECDNLQLPAPNFRSLQSNGEDRDETVKRRLIVICMYVLFLGHETCLLELSFPEGNDRDIYTI